MKKSCYKENIKDLVILNLIQDLRRLLLSFRNSVRGRFQIKFGMTPLLSNSAFTLVELLVVVLIIGILAAIALPQYQKSVAKARLANLLVVGRELHEAQERYYLEHGSYTTNIDKMDVAIDLSDFNVKWTSIVLTLTHKNEPKLQYVWYPRHTYRSGTNTRYNNQRECRVYDTTDGHEILKQECREATGAQGGNSGSDYWVAYFPTNSL